MKISFKLLTTTLVLIFTAACTPDANQPSGEDAPESTVGLLNHTVYFYLNEDVTEEEKADFEEGLKELLSIEEVYYYQVGKPGSTPERDVTDHSFGYSIFSWFQTMEDYEVYAEHPIHMQFIDDYEHLWADVKVYDSEIIAEKEFYGN